jgi:hypothetical protein
MQARQSAPAYSKKLKGRELPGLSILRLPDRFLDLMRESS